MFPAGRRDIRVRMVELPGGVTVRVAEAGREDGRPVVLLHGWGASIYMWRDWFARLAHAGRRVIAVDLPGHGLSSKPADASAYRTETLVENVAQFLRAEGLEGTDIVAQSMAGSLGLELLLGEDVKVGRLVLINPACFGRVRNGRLFRLISPSFVDLALPRLVARSVVARAHRLVYADASRITRADEDEYWAPSQFPAYARSMRRLLREFTWRRAPVRDLGERLRPRAHRVLVVLGDRDRLILDAGKYVGELAEQAAGLSVLRIAEGGHAVNEELPEMVAAHTLEFLDRA